MMSTTITSSASSSSSLSSSSSSSWQQEMCSAVLSILTTTMTTSHNECDVMTLRRCLSRSIMMLVQTSPSVSSSPPSASSSTCSAASPSSCLAVSVDLEETRYWRQRLWHMLCIPLLHHLHHQQQHHQHQHEHVHTIDKSVSSMSMMSGDVYALWSVCALLSHLPETVQFIRQSDGDVDADADANSDGDGDERMVIEVALRALTVTIPVEAYNANDDMMSMSREDEQSLRYMGLQLLTAMLECHDTSSSSSSCSSSYSSSLLKSVFIPHLAAAVNVLLRIAMSSSRTATMMMYPARVRVSALRTLKIIASLSASKPSGSGLIPYASLYPFKKVMVQALGAALDDRKRAVRHFAASARNEWSAL